MTPHTVLSSKTLYLTSPSAGFPQAGCTARERLVDDTGKAIHPCQGPVALYSELLRPLSRSGAIFDPYMGTGTCGVAAKRDGRTFIGCERDPKYFDIAVKRIEAELNRFPLIEPETKPKQRELIGV